MKYIRTKDGIKAYNESCDLSYVYQCIGGIKIADTIPELCDCYSYMTETTRDYLVAKSWKKADKSRRIYGCILTDKGLIYVAKMKGILSNGEIDWELL